MLSKKQKSKMQRGGGGPSPTMLKGGGGDFPLPTIGETINVASLIPGTFTTAPVKIGGYRRRSNRSTRSKKNRKSKSNRKSRKNRK
jgi:hypothetical protein